MFKKSWKKENKFSLDDLFWAMFSQYLILKLHLSFQRCWLIAPTTWRRGESERGRERGREENFQCYSLAEREKNLIQFWFHFFYLMHKFIHIPLLMCLPYFYRRNFFALNKWNYSVKCVISIHNLYLISFTRLHLQIETFFRILKTQN